MQTIQLVEHLSDIQQNNYVIVFAKAVFVVIVLC